MSQSCTKVVQKLSPHCLKVVSKSSLIIVKVVYLKVGSKLSRSFIKAFSKFNQSCLQVVPSGARSGKSEKREMRENHPALVIAFPHLLQTTLQEHNRRIQGNCGKRDVLCAFQPSSQWKPEQPCHLCNGHTWYLSFFLHWQNFWKIKFTPKNANFSR